MIRRGNLATTYFIQFQKLPFGKVGISKAIALKWIAIDKSGGDVRLIRKVNGIEDTVQKQLQAVAEGKSADLGAKTLQELKKRKLLTEM